MLIRSDHIHVQEIIFLSTSLLILEAFFEWLLAMAAQRVSNVRLVFISLDVADVQFDCRLRPCFADLRVLVILALNLLE